MQIDLPYLMQDVDRHGNIRLYVRRKNVGKVRLRLPPGSPNFTGEYEAALKRLSAGKQPAAGGPPKIGTLGWLAQEFESSYDFRKIGPRERRVRHQIMAATLDEPPRPGSPSKFRDCPIGEFTADHVRLLRNRKQATPAAANHRVTGLRVMLAWGMEERSSWVKKNVAAEAKKLRYVKQGFHTWTVDEVRQFEKHYPIGTKERLALSLMLFTGMRRSDAVLLGARHVKDGWITFIPTKTATTTQKAMQLPMLEILDHILKLSLLGSVTFLETGRGKPFTANGFGNWFRERCDTAGLLHCTAHGLRKAGAKIAAENGATEKQLMAIFGWDSPALAAHYSKMASQKKLAGDAMHLLIAQE